MKFWAFVILFLLMNIPVFAAENNEKVELLLIPEQESGGDAANVIDAQLKIQGLQFTSGGIRPMDQKGTGYPIIGDDVIYLILEPKN